MKRLSKNFYIVICSLAMIFLLGSSAIAQSQKKINKLKRESDEAKAEFLKQDPGMSKFFNGAYGYVIFPNVGKGGFVVGGASGMGIVYEKGNKVGHAKLKQLSIGFQAGGQAYREVIFFETKTDLDRFKSGNFEFSAQASAVVVSTGISADAKYSEGVSVFTMPKGGLMYEASIGGQKFSYDKF